MRVNGHVNACALALNPWVFKTRLAKVWGLYWLAWCDKHQLSCSPFFIMISLFVQSRSTEFYLWSLVVLFTWLVLLKYHMRTLKMQNPIGIHLLENKYWLLWYCFVWLFHRVAVLVQSGYSSSIFQRKGNWRAKSSSCYYVTLNMINTNWHWGRGRWDDVQTCTSSWWVTQLNTCPNASQNTIRLGRTVGRFCLQHFEPDHSGNVIEVVCPIYNVSSRYSQFHSYPVRSIAEVISTVLYNPQMCIV